jgi:ABC-type transporter Mla subunit MlaD
VENGSELELEGEVKRLSAALVSQSSQLDAAQERLSEQMEVVHAAIRSMAPSLGIAVAGTAEVRETVRRMERLSNAMDAQKDTLDSVQQQFFQVQRQQAARTAGDQV